jgi:hypothetical protein
MNQSEAARTSGINQSTISFRVRRYGVTPEEATKKRKWSRPDSLATKARAHGITANTVRARIRNKGWTLEQALTYPLMWTRKADRWSSPLI